MEYSKKELVEKLNLIHKLLAEKKYKNARISLGALIFSINSDAQAESPTVGENEHQEKDCFSCMFTFLHKDTYPCVKCVDFSKWQSD